MTEKGPGLDSASHPASVQNTNIPTAAPAIRSVVIETVMIARRELPVQPLPPAERLREGIGGGSRQRRNREESDPDDPHREQRRRETACQRPKRLRGFPGGLDLREAVLVER